MKTNSHAIVESELDNPVSLESVMHWPCRILCLSGGAYDEQHSMISIDYRKDYSVRCRVPIAVARSLPKVCIGGQVLDE